MTFELGVGMGAAQPGGTTGRYLLVFHEGATEAGVGILADVAGLGVAHLSESDNRVITQDMRQAGALVFDELGVAIVDAAPDQIQSLGSASVERAAFVALEPERIVYALEAPWGTLGPPVGGAPLTAEYVRGYADAAGHLAAAAGAGLPAPRMAAASASAQPFDESLVTWGLQATGAAVSSRTGEGVGVAVLDTGLDRTHPDFADREIAAESFVVGEDPGDGHGHGTHCVGTACGSRDASPPRYGVAPGAAIFAAKVLNDSGRGTDGDILAGIEWAMAQRCRVASLSLGAPTVPGQSYSGAFEKAGRRALENGTLIVAAAGNDSARDAGLVRPVSHPANCPSIVAVAALDTQLGVATFSNRGTNPAGGQIDIAAPGVAVHSSWLMPARYRAINGTSMATPHVAGIAALLAEANPAGSANDLVAALTRHARRLALPCNDVGAGLAQAP